MSGLMSKKFAVKNGKGYKSTEKILIVGPSGSGKTSLACNLIYYRIKPFCEIVFVMPEGSHSDCSIETLKKWCNDVDIPVSTITIEDLLAGKNKDKNKGIQISDSSVWVIDDYYTSTSRNMSVEKLLKELVNRGRHDGKHVIYCAQLARNLPAEIKINNTGIYLSGDIVGDEDLYQYFSIKPPNNIDVLAREKFDKHTWLEYDKDVTQPIEFVEPHGMAHIRQTLEHKIPLEVRKNKKKNIGYSAAMGNKVAEHVVKKKEKPLSLSEIHAQLENINK